MERDDVRKWARFRATSLVKRMSWFGAHLEQILDQAAGHGDPGQACPSQKDLADELFRAFQSVANLIQEHTRSSVGRRILFQSLALAPGNCRLYFLYPLLLRLSGLEADFDLIDVCIRRLVLDRRADLPELRSYYEERARLHQSESGLAFAKIVDVGSCLRAAFLIDAGLPGTAAGDGQDVATPGAAS